MTTYLFSLLSTGAEKLAQTDPHGFTLTLISVLVVFISLIILYCVYTLSGNLFSGKIKIDLKKKKKAADVDDEVAVAIALALRQHLGGEEEKAAIATALHLYLNNSVHDVESGIITIRKSETLWADKQRLFRKSPRK